MNSIYNFGESTCNYFLPMVYDHAAEVCNQSNIQLATTVGVGAMAFLCATKVIASLKGRIQNFDNFNLWYCAVRGDLRGLAQCIQKGVDINTIDHTIGDTALIASVKMGHISVAKELLKEEADPNIANSSTGQSALHIACSLSRHDLAALLLNHGANVNLQDREGSTPLMACFEGAEFPLGCFDALLQSNALLIDAQNGKKETVLHLAAKKGINVKKVLDKGANADLQNEQGEIPLHVAVKTNNQQNVQYLIQKTQDINIKNSKGETAFLTCIRSAFENKKKKEESLTQFFQGVFEGQQKSPAFLFFEKADLNMPDLKGEYPIQIAIKNVDQNEQLALSLIQAQNIDLKVKDPNGNTLAHLAALGENQKIVQSLQEKGVSFDALNNEKETPLSLALKGGKEFELFVQNLSYDQLCNMKIHDLSLIEYSIVFGNVKLYKFLASKRIYLELTDQNRDRLQKLLLDQSESLLKEMKKFSPAKLSDLSELIQELEIMRQRPDAQTKSEKLEQLELGIKHYLEKVALQSGHYKRRTHTEKAELFGILLPFNAFYQEVLGGKKGEFIEFLSKEKAKIPLGATPFLAKDWSFSELMEYAVLGIRSTKFENLVRSNTGEPKPQEGEEEHPIALQEVQN